MNNENDRLTDIIDDMNNEEIEEFMCSECPNENDLFVCELVNRYEEDIYPVYIQKNGTTTIVYWNDDTRTTVRASEDESQSYYGAFCAALAKKIYGSNSAVHRMIEEVSDYHVKELEAKEKELRKKENERIGQINHMKKVRRLAKQMRLAEEAMKYNETMYPVEDN